MDESRRRCVIWRGPPAGSGRSLASISTGCHGLRSAFTDASFNYSGQRPGQGRITDPHHRAAAVVVGRRAPEPHCPGCAGYHGPGRPHSGVHCTFGSVHRLRFARGSGRRFPPEGGGPALARAHHRARPLRSVWARSADPHADRHQRPGRQPVRSLQGPAQHHFEHRAADRHQGRPGSRALRGQRRAQYDRRRSRHAPAGRRCREPQAARSGLASRAIHGRPDACAARGVRSHRKQPVDRQRQRRARSEGGGDRGRGAVDRRGTAARRQGCPHGRTGRASHGGADVQPGLEPAASGTQDPDRRARGREAARPAMDDRHTADRTVRADDHGRPVDRGGGNLAAGPDRSVAEGHRGSRNADGRGYDLEATRDRDPRSKRQPGAGAGEAAGQRGEKQSAATARCTTAASTSTSPRRSRRSPPRPNGERIWRRPWPSPNASSRLATARSWTACAS